MEILLDVIGLVAVAALFGSMAFFTFLMAPLIFVKLEAATAGRFVRGVFPWYYLAIAVLSGLALAALVTTRPLEAGIMVLIGLGAIASRQMLMPAINRRRDRMVAGDPAAEKAFNRLHGLSVWINAAQLLAALAVLVRMAIT